MPCDADRGALARLARRASRAVLAHGSRRTTIRSTLRFPGHDLALRAPRLLQRVLAEEKLSPVRGRLVHPGHRLARRAVVLVLVLVGGVVGFGLAAVAIRLRRRRPPGVPRRDPRRAPRGRKTRLAPQRGLDLHRGRGAFVPRSLSFVPRSLSSFVLVPAVWERPEALGPRGRGGVGAVAVAVARPASTPSSPTRSWLDTGARSSSSPSRSV